MNQSIRVSSIAAALLLTVSVNSHAGLFKSADKQTRKELTQNLQLLERRIEVLEQHLSDRVSKLENNLSDLEKRTPITCVSGNCDIQMDYSHTGVNFVNGIIVLHKRQGKFVWVDFVNWDNKPENSFLARAIGVTDEGQLELDYPTSCKLYMNEAPIQVGQTIRGQYCKKFGAENGKTYTVKSIIEVTPEL